MSAILPGMLRRSISAFHSSPSGRGTCSAVRRLERKDARSLDTVGPPFVKTGCGAVNGRSQTCLIQEDKGRSLAQDVSGCKRIVKEPLRLQGLLASDVQLVSSSKRSSHSPQRIDRPGLPQTLASQPGQTYAVFFRASRFFLASSVPPAEVH